MMAQKAAYFGDYRTHARILGACTPRDCKALGRMVSGFQEESWRQVREQIVLCGNFQKFLQNPPFEVLPFADWRPCFGGGQSL